LLDGIFCLTSTKGKEPPVKTGGIAVFGRCPPAYGGCFHPPVETGGIKTGTNKESSNFYATKRRS